MKKQSLLKLLTIFSLSAFCSQAMADSELEVEAKSWISTESYSQEVNNFKITIGGSDISADNYKELISFQTLMFGVGAKWIHEDGMMVFGSFSGGGLLGQTREQVKSTNPQDLGKVASQYGFVQFDSKKKHGGGRQCGNLGVGYRLNLTEGYDVFPIVEMEYDNVKIKNYLDYSFFETTMKQPSKGSRILKSYAVNFKLLSKLTLTEDLFASFDIGFSLPKEKQVLKDVNYQGRVSFGDFSKNGKKFVAGVGLKGKIGDDISLGVDYSFSCMRSSPKITMQTTSYSNATLEYASGSLSGKIKRQSHKLGLSFFYSF